MSKGNDAYRTISEVAKWLGTQSHVLRYWESKFDDLKPMKSSGGRRYYRPEDMRLLGGIKHMLHGEGITIKGLQKILKDEGVEHIASFSPPLDLTEKKTKKSEQAKDQKPARDLSGQTRVDNVIAFTINPLPVAKSKKAAEGQPSLFPELEGQPITPLALTPEYSTATPSGRADDPVKEAPMLNLFEDDPDGTVEAELQAEADPILTRFLPKTPKKSQFANEPRTLSQLFAMDRAARYAQIQAHEDILRPLVSDAQ